MRVFGDAVVVAAGQQENPDQVPFARIGQKTEGVVIKQAVVELDPSRIAVFVMLKLLPIFDGKMRGQVSPPPVTNGCAANSRAISFSRGFTSARHSLT